MCLLSSLLLLAAKRTEWACQTLTVSCTALDQAIRDAAFSHKSDVFSFGVLMWEICSLGKPPCESRLCVPFWLTIAPSCGRDHTLPCWRMAVLALCRAGQWSWAPMAVHCPVLYAWRPSYCQRGGVRCARVQVRSVLTPGTAAARSLTFDLVPASPNPPCVRGCAHAGGQGARLGWRTS